MTPKQFQDRLHRLVKKAVEEGFCLLCVSRDLRAVAQVLQDHVNPTPEDLRRHPIFEADSAPGCTLHQAPETLQ